jgi:hypothetical protein
MKKINIIEKFDKIENIIVSVDYSDLLDITLKENSGIFDHTIVVTSTKDKKTQKVCKKYNCTLILTDSFYDEDSYLNKGKAINLAYSKLKYKQWVANMDADIILFKNFKKIFFDSFSNMEALYWMPRLMFNTPDEWVDFLKSPKPKNPQIEEEALGYFQLYHYNSKVFQLLNEHNSNKPYYEFSKDASMSDLMFKNMWKRDFRLKLNMVCYHLGESMKNWKGRVTPEFKIKS